MSTREKKTIKGSCHCGFIQYTLAISPDPSTGHLDAARCNCTFCQKFGTTNLALHDPSDFHLLSPASKDDSGLGSYAPRVKTLPRYFCNTCSVYVWMEGYFEMHGQKVTLFAVNIATVDQPQEDFDLNQVKIQYRDLLHGNYAGGLKDAPWPGGLP